MYRERVHVVDSGFMLGTVSECEIISFIGPSKGVSLADLVDFHNPPNTAILLGYITEILMLSMVRRGTN
jgi:hypothetical protein